MADHKDVGAPALDTAIESGGFDEKQHQHGAAAPPPKAVPAADEDEDEDIDALIEDLESEDGHAAIDDEEEEGTAATGGRVVPEDMLQTDSRVGLTEAEVTQRRRKYGLNQMKEEKENLILKFFSYFIGPIQFVMEVSTIFFFVLCFAYSAFVCLFTGQCFTCGFVRLFRTFLVFGEQPQSLCALFRLN